MSNPATTSLNKDAFTSGAKLGTENTPDADQASYKKGIKTSKKSGKDQPAYGAKKLTEFGDKPPKIKKVSTDSIV